MTRFAVDLRHAIRALGRSATFTAAVVLTLALGIGIASGIFTVASALLWRPLPFEDPDRLVHIWAADRRSDRLEVTPLDYRDWRDQNRTFQGLGAFTMGEVHVRAGATSERVQAAHVSAGLFELLGVSPVLGRTMTADEERRGDRVVVMSHAWWKAQLGGSPSVLGQPLFLSGTPYTIIGVMGDRFTFPIPTTDLWLPLTLAPDDINRRVGVLRVVGRLAADATLDRAQQDLGSVAATLSREYPDTNAERGVRVVPLREGLMFGYDRIVPLSRVLLGACVFVLLLVYANVWTLMLARALAGRRQIAIRSALGASRLSQMRPALIEGALLAVGGALAGLLLAGWLAEALGAAIPENIYHVGPFGVSGDTLLLTLALGVLSATVIGLVPMLGLAGADVAGALREGPSASQSRLARRRFQLLAIAQIAIATLLLAAALLMTASVRTLNRIDPGFRPERVLTLELSLPSPQYESRQDIVRFVRDVREHADASDGVVSVAAVNFLPLNHENRWRQWVVQSATEPDAQSRRALELVVTDAYFRTMGVPIAAGRDFHPDDDADAPPVAIVNESFVRERLTGRNPIGARLAVRTDDRAPEWRTIVGVAADAKHVDLAGPAHPQVFVPFYQEPWGYFRLLARTTGDAREAAPILRTALTATDQYVGAARIRTLRDVVAESLLAHRIVAGSLAGLAAGALLLVIVGVYGVIAYTVSLRSREFAVRLALGARRASVLRLVLQQAAWLAAIGVGLGVLAAIGLGAGLSRFLYGIQADDGTVLSAVGFLIAAVTLVASLVPACRASRVNPIGALRSE